MTEEIDRTNADRDEEVYYNKERRGGYAVAFFGLLAFVAVAVIMLMQHMDISVINYPNVEPSSGSSAVESNTVGGTPDVPSKDTNTVSPNIVQPDNPPQ
jgi:hypothetical protein